MINQHEYPRIESLHDQQLSKATTKPQATLHLITDWDALTHTGFYGVHVSYQNQVVMACHILKSLNHQTLLLEAAQHGFVMLDLYEGQAVTVITASDWLVHTAQNPPERLSYRHEWASLDQAMTGHTVYWQWTTQIASESSMARLWAEVQALKTKTQRKRYQP